MRQTVGGIFLLSLQVIGYVQANAPTPFPKNEGGNKSTAAIGASVAAVVLVGIACYVFCFRASNGTTHDEVGLGSTKVLQNIPIGDIGKRPEGLSPPATFVPAKGEPSGPQMQLLVTFDFQGENDDELTVSKDEILTVVQKVDAEWYEARSTMGKVGLIPANYVSPMETNDDFF
mmetsp:Transcript_2381/g.5608  ORF Transcript_2381/g.5608 Transcript_2381/m.5608 type:complete len:174 (-) Transcript_2381:75-596(-)